MDKYQKWCTAILIILSVLVLFLAGCIKYYVFLMGPTEKQEDVPQQSIQSLNCQSTKILEEAVFSEKLEARVEECRIGTDTYSRVVVKNDNQEKIIEMSILKGPEAEDPFFGFVAIKFLNEKYLTYKDVFWEGYGLNLYNLQNGNKVSLGAGAEMGDSSDSRYFIVYGYNEMSGEKQLKVYSLLDGQLVKDFQVQSFYNTCSLGNNGVIACENSDGKDYYSL